MGTEYRLFRANTREAFNLGKGAGWSRVFPMGLFRMAGHFPTVASLAAAMRRDWWPISPPHPWPNVNNDDISDEEIQTIAERIMRWAGDAALWMDNEAACEPDDPMWRWPVTGTRWINDDA